MDKENLLNRPINHIPSDALNTPSKAQEQMLETSSQEKHKDITQDLYGTDLPISDVERTTNKK
ncbi:hypothetical protein CN941_13325 [Bacillus cereus]|uniref:hypothetical protein n=1 Tax=Bacillus nitratireducens TaxID=2026193 RepID=UPI00027907E9|nr:hypothetical protein [Bacillus nitratireducens]EJQ13584.1 cytochrome b [Bacillus cereus BAG3X2-1]PEA21726.1 hypothetical protein CON40_07960 [Bacillus cereus]PEU02307.1 hypothetical protein CN527_08945 [Bacillus cereus]PEV99296.1 hypothetical protein CN428_20430 [Bacillus cereus]PEZ90349.1 hypothetical protein CN374_12115 [Bacillus cereus]